VPKKFFSQSSFFAFFVWGCKKDALSRSYFGSMTPSFQEAGELLFPWLSFFTLGQILAEEERLFSR